MQTIVIIGSGAIGRGFLPWVIPEDRYELIFVDSDVELIQQMRLLGQYRTYRTDQGRLIEKQVRVKAALLPEELDPDLLSDCAGVFVCVGPRNCLNATKHLSKITTPVIVCENDPACAAHIRQRNALPHCVFAIPDVIASNTASEAILAQDPLAIVTETGILYVETSDNLPLLKAVICSPEELQVQWLAKLYLHNTPHCIAAYLSSLAGLSCMHNGMELPAISAIVEGAMLEMLETLSCMGLDAEFLHAYAHKELSRFKNPLLADPISRVGREPLRKLERGGRLLGAAEICLAYGVAPHSITLGIAGALQFREPSDPDVVALDVCEALDQESLFKYLLQLRSDEALSLWLHRHMQSARNELISLGLIQKPSPRPYDLERAAILSVAQAGHLLEQSLPSAISEKETPRDLVTLQDLQAQTAIVDLLSMTSVPILAEEGISSQPHVPSCYWAVDPLDGTVNYVYGVPLYTSSVGLVIEHSCTLGAVVAPTCNDLYFSAGGKAFLNGRPLHPRLTTSRLEDALFACAFSSDHQSPLRSLEYALFQHLNDNSRGCLRIGSAALAICWVASGRLDGAHGIRVKIWDVAGALAIARQAGCETFLYQRSPHEVDFIVGGPLIVAAVRTLWEWAALHNQRAA